MIYAESVNETSLDNANDTSDLMTTSLTNDTGNTTNNTSDTTAGSNSLSNDTSMSNDTSTGNDTTSNNSSEKATSSASESASADNDSAHGSIWVKASDMDKVNLTQLKEGGIQDIFLEQQAFEKTEYQTSLNNFLKAAQTANIRVNAWVICFKDNGTWIDPTGQYSYTVNTPYTATVKTAYKYYYKTKVKVPYYKYVKSYYKSYYKSWYKYKGKWRYKWKYKYRYKWVKKTYYKYVYKTTYTWKYKTSYVTKYKTETKYGYNTTYINSYINNLTDRIVNYTNTEGVGGIHLDYIRYPGTAYKSTNGTQAITNFVEHVSSTVKAINPSAIVSAALMPETSSNAYYYGQDYTQLGKYLDVLIPMIYEGNYNKDNNWIASVTSYISSHSSGAQVWAGLQTYESDSNPKPLSANVLTEDVQTALNNGATGYALFRYGNVLNNEFFDQSADLKINDTTIISLQTIQETANTLLKYLDDNRKLPTTIKINGKDTNMSEFLYLLTTAIQQLQTGTQDNIQFKTVTNPTNVSGNSTNGTIQQTEYLDLVQQIINYINTNGTAPSNISTSLGNMKFDSLVYIMAKIVDFQADNNRLPGYVTYDETVFKAKATSTTTTTKTSTSPYLQATKNCQVNDATIKALAASLTKGITSYTAKATKIFNWVRDKLSYSFYYNTKYGAVNTLKYKKGNCVDHAHLVTALMRAAGIMTRYAHGNCRFSSGSTYGHVWAEVYLGGKWIKADATSSRNSLGVVKSNTVLSMKGRYTSLPF